MPEPLHSVPQVLHAGHPAQSLVMSTSANWPATKSGPAGLFCSPLLRQRATNSSFFIGFSSFLPTGVANDASAGQVSFVRQRGFAGLLAEEFSVRQKR